MADIRYICFSDMHFGAEDSLLTNLKDGGTETNPMIASPVMAVLVDCMRELISKNSSNKKPALVLDGDILELALNTTNQAAMVFCRFIELILPEDGENLFEKIIYIPGNHDHHLWEITRETQYVEYIKSLLPESFLEAPWHTTNLFELKHKMPESYFLKNLIQRFDHLKQFEISIAYPNFGLLNENKGILFHHGHFVESIYILMSSVINLLSSIETMPTNIWDIEAENFAWIDFFWSTLGRSGAVGRDVEILYNKMQNPTAFKEVLNTLAKNLIEGYSRVRLGKKAKISTFQWILDKLYDRFSNQEKKADSILSTDAETALSNYMNDPMYLQIKSELKNELPSDVTFIFGHTHKPFEDNRNFNKYSNAVKVYNSGGWVVENTVPNPLHGGAMILLDEEYNTVSLRMYNEHKTKDEYNVEIKETLREGQGHTMFYERIKDLVHPDKDPWKNFSVTVAQEVDIRIKNLERRINKEI